MYLLDIDISGLKLLRDFRLSLRDAQGRPRMWTVLVGENGLCKTSILQAIAMAASGYARANQLADVPSLPDRRRPEKPIRIHADFTFGSVNQAQREYPGLATQPHAPPQWSPSSRFCPGTTSFMGTPGMAKYIKIFAHTAP